MKRFSLAAALIVALALCAMSCRRGSQTEGDAAKAGVTNSSGAAGQTTSSQPPTAPQTQLKVGDRAPDFELTDTEGQKVRLSDYRGKKNVVLAFYVLAFTGG